MHRKRLARLMSLATQRRHFSGISHRAVRDSAYLTPSSLSINDEYRDLTVVCGEHVYSVHRVILCEQSTFFRAACKGQTFLEGRQRLITLRARSTDADDQDLGADDPDIIWFIMQYLYCDHLNDGSTVGKPAPTLRRLKVNAGVFATADKYGMPGLKALAHTNFDIIATEWCKAYISCAVEIAQEVQECWAGIIELVYLDSPSHLKELREVVFKVLACPRVRLLETEMVGAAVERVEGLTYDLVKFARLSVYPHRERHGCLCLGAE